MTRPEPFAARPTPGPTGSFYETTVTRARYPRATGRLNADVCIIGGGFTGLSTALECAQRGLKVVLLEAEQLGFGASGRNGGQVCTGFSVEPAGLVARFGVERARALFALSEEAKRIVTARAQAADLRWGYLFAARSAAALRELDARMHLLDQTFGHPPGELLDKAALDQRLRSPRYIGGHFDPTAGQLNPLKYAQALAAAAAAAGVTLYEDSRALDWQGGVVRTAEAEIHAPCRVLAGNGYLSPTPATILPVNSYIAATRPLTAAEQAETLPQQDAVCEFAHILNYYRLAPGGELLFGGGATYSGRDPADLAAFVRAKLRSVFPALAAIPFQQVWSGRIAITLSRIPEFGCDGRGLYWAQGFSGQGVALTAIAGRLIAEAIDGSPERFNLLAGIDHRAFPGGRGLRGPIQALAMSYYRLRDLIG